MAPFPPHKCQSGWRMGESVRTKVLSILAICCVEWRTMSSVRQKSSLSFGCDE